jgi:uncharacterized protein YceH (UPF0502 family)
LEDDTPDQDSVPEGAAESTETTPALLSNIEARILGSLMEKQMATPDAYPLTVNSLLNACNQKTSREPVTNLQQGEVVRSLRELEGKKFVRYEMGARSERYEQTLSSALSLSRKQQALLCVMLLRGPQTANELLSRTQRLHAFENKDDMEVSLTRMTQGDEPVACLIGRAAGQRDDRYGHLLCGPISNEVLAASSAAASSAGAAGNQNEYADKIEALTDEVLELREMLEKLYQLTGHPLPPN